MAQNVRDAGNLDPESGIRKGRKSSNASPAQHHQTEDRDTRGKTGGGTPPKLSRSNSVVDKAKAMSHFRHVTGGSDLWVDGLLCAYEYIPAAKNKVEVGGKFGSNDGPVQGNFTAQVVINDKQGPKDLPMPAQAHFNGRSSDPKASNPESKSDVGEEKKRSSSDSAKGGKDLKDLPRNMWVPIGWARISELVQYVEHDSLLSEYMLEQGDDWSDDDVTVADQVAPYWQQPAGPIWWCHVHAAHPHIRSWLSHAQWLHQPIREALIDESRLISDKMKHLFYEVPVRVAGGLLFELLGQSVGDPKRNEDDVPIVLRSWTSLNFLITAMHVKGDVPNDYPNVLGIFEVQDIVGAGGILAPHTAHEIVALLAERLARWDDRLYRKTYFGAADEVELKFVNRTGNEDLAILSILLNQEIRRLSAQVIIVKWRLHAREEIVYELQAHLKGKNTRACLSRIAKNTRNILGEQEAVRDRLFTVQDVMQSTVRASLQDKSVRIQHNLAIIGGGGLFLSIITGLFGINVDGMPGAENTPYAFGLFSALLAALGIFIVGLGMLYLGFRKPPTEEQLASRKLELQNLVKKFQFSAETHVKVRDVGGSSEHSPAGFYPVHVAGSEDYFLIP